MLGSTSSVGCWKNYVWLCLRKSFARPCRSRSSVCRKPGRRCSDDELPGPSFSTISCMTQATAPSFVHLRVHSEYSVVDGIIQISQLIKSVSALGQPAVALTDLGNIFGLIKFYKAARGAGVKPIAGCDAWLENEAEPDKPYRILLLVSSHEGYLNLCELLTQAWLDNQRAGRAELKRQWLAGRKGLIVLS